MTRYKLALKPPPDLCDAVPDEPEDQREGRAMLSRTLHTSQGERRRACEKMKRWMKHRAVRQLPLPVGDR